MAEMRFDLDTAVTCVRTLMAMGIKPDSFTVPVETKCEIENASIEVSMTVSAPLGDNVKPLQMEHPFTFCGIRVNVTR
jgi:hypothetical protein